jgi:selenocysteine-specific translation elongation factor
MDLQKQFEVKETDVKRWAEMHDIPVFFTSALTGDGIEDLKNKLAKRLTETISQECESTPMGSPLSRRTPNGGCCS